MFIIFGWVKEVKEVGPALDCHCYRCQRKRTWEHWKEIEWVSFFLIKTIPFIMLFARAAASPFGWIGRIPDC